MPPGGNPFDAPYENPFGGPSSSSRNNGPSTYSGAGPSSKSPFSSEGYFNSTPPVSMPSKAAVQMAAAVYAPPEQEAKPSPNRGLNLLRFGRGGNSAKADTAGAAEGRGDAAKPADDKEHLPWWARATVPLFPCGAIKVRMHVLLPAYLAIQAANGFGQSTERGFVNLIVIGPFLFLTVLVHELGHAGAAKLLGGQAHSILLWPLGGMAFLSHIPTAKADILVALAGPMVHVPMGVIWYFLFDSAAGDWEVTGGGGVKMENKNFWTQICYSMLAMQFILFFFNLFIPAFPLDGGRIMVDMFAMCNFERNSAAYVTAAISSFWGLLMLAYGVVISSMERRFHTCVLIGMWILWQAWGIWRMVKNGKVGEHPMFAKFDGGEAEPAPPPAQRNDRV